MHKRNLNVGAPQAFPLCISTRWPALEDGGVGGEELHGFEFKSKLPTILVKPCEYTLKWLVNSGN